LDARQEIVSDNFYWLPDSAGMYSGLQRMNKAALEVDVQEGRGRQAAMRQDGGGQVGGRQRIVVTLRNPAGGPVAFFNRVSLVDPATKKRVLPVFYSDNYVSVLPGESKMVTLDYTPVAGAAAPLVSVRGWNVAEAVYPVGH